MLIPLVAAVVAVVDVAFCGRGFYMRILFIIFLLSMTDPLYSMFEVRKAAIEGGKYFNKNHDLFLNIDDELEKLHHTTNMIMDVDLVCSSQNEVCFFWNNAVKSKATNKQYRSVSWDFRAGFSLGEHLEVGVHHISTHELDRHQSYHYPMENVVYLQMIFINKPRKIIE